MEKTDREDEDGERRDQPQPGGQSVETVDKIHGVDGRDGNSNGEQSGLNLIEDDGGPTVTAERVVDDEPADAHHHENASSSHLTDKFGEGVEAPPVVDHTHEDDDGASYERSVYVRTAEAETSCERG